MTAKEQNISILLTGGAASGKSTFAEALCMHLPAPWFYIDAARPDPYDPARPRRRERLVGQGFCVFAQDTDIGDLVLPARGTVLLECLCHLTANEMFDERGIRAELAEKIIQGIKRLAGQCRTLIIVSNEIGSGMGSYTEETRRYIRTLGRINAALAAEVDMVYEMICGIALLRKGTGL